ncbi:MAG TPA: DUF6526 family protein [Bryobacteraceae bacterium]|nr:DUF6526 family protein [Bryobacteraceae bacterium]
MSELIPQTRENHTRLDPAYHYFLVPAYLLLLIWAVVDLVRDTTTHAAILAALTLLALVLALKARTYSLKVQDRLIRLEERLRLSMLLSDSQRVRINELTEAQLIALRFAADAEAPALVARALNEGLKPKTIKALIQSWRGDYFRV